MTGLNKDVRIRFSDDGADKVRKNMKDVGADADKLSGKEITPKLDLKGVPEAKKGIDEVSKLGDNFAKKSYSAKLEANKERAEKNVRDVNASLDKYGKRKDEATVGLKGNDVVGAQLDHLTEMAKKFDHTISELRVGVKGNDKAMLAIDRLQLRADKWGHSIDKADIGINGVAKAELEMRGLSLSLDELNKKLTVTEKVSKKRGTFGNLVGALGGDAFKNLFSGGSGGGGGGIVGDVAKDAEDAGGDAGNAFTGAFGQQLKVGLIAAAVVAVAAITPAILPAFIGLGAGLGGAVIAGFTHKDLQKHIKSDFNGIMADLGKDTTPLVKPLEQMGNQLEHFVKGESGPLRDMFKAALPFLSMFMHLFEQVGKQAIPVFTAAMKQIKPLMPEIMAGFKSLLQAVLVFIKALGPGMAPSANLFRLWMTAIKGALWLVAESCNALALTLDLLAKGFQGIVIAAKDVAKWIKTGVTDAFRTLARDVPKWWDDTWAALKHALSNFVNFFEKTWNDVTGFTRRVFGDIEHAVKTAWDDTWNWAKNTLHSFVNSVEGLWNNIVSTAKRIFNNIENAVKHTWDDVWSWAKNRLHTFWNDVVSIWGDIFNSSKRIFGNIENAVKHIWDDMWSWAKNRVHTFWNDVVSIWGDIFNSVKRIFGNIENAVKHIWDDVWSWAKNRVHQFWDDVVSIWGDIFNSSKRIFGNVENAVKHIWDDLWHWGKDRLTQFSNDVGAIFDHIYTFSGNVFQRIKSNVEHIWSSFWNNIKSAGSSAVNWIINNVLNPLGGIWDHIASFLHLGKSMQFPKIGNVGGKQNGGLIGDGDPKMFASGGKIGGQGRGDRHHIVVESGEVVVPRRVVPKYAMGFRQDGIPGFQNGGMVDGYPAFVNGGTPDPQHPGTGSPSGGGPGQDQNVHRQGTNPRGTTSKKILANNGNLSLSGMLKDIKNDAISLAFKPITSVIDAGVKDAKSMGGFAELVGDAAQQILAKLIDSLESKANNAVSGSATGRQIATYAKQFVGHRYVLGGSGDYQTNHNKPYGPWDCAGFVSQMYDHFNLGSPTQGINVTALRNWSHNQHDKKPTIGGMAFFVGADGTSTHPGHVGMVTGPNQSIQAMDEALGTRMSDLSGALWFATPPGGFGKGGAGQTGGPGTLNLAKFLLSAGYSRAAAAAAAGVANGEGGGNPESVGSGGAGLIGWTPPGAMRSVGATCHAVGIGNNSTAQDMASQEHGMVKWMTQNGWGPPQDHWPQTPAGAISAAYNASASYEKPLVPGSDVRDELGTIRSLFSSLSGGMGSNKKGQQQLGQKRPGGGGGSLANKKHLALGGIVGEPVFGMGLRTGASYAIAENGPEMITPVNNMSKKSSSGNNYYISIESGVSSPADVGRTVIQCVTKYEQHQGKRGPNLTFS